MDIKIQLGKRIKELRKTHNMTQEMLAEKLSIETPNLCRLENGVHFPQTNKIEQLANIFEVPVYELFRFEHFNNQDALKSKIIKFSKNASLKELEFLCKTIDNILEYKK